VGPRIGLDDVEKRKFLTLPGPELRPLGRSQSLDRLRYPGSFKPVYTASYRIIRLNIHGHENLRPEICCVYFFQLSSSGNSSSFICFQTLEVVILLLDRRLRFRPDMCYKPAVEGDVHTRGDLLCCVCKQFVGLQLLPVAPPLFLISEMSRGP
jgi:hypothetical protein